MDATTLRKARQTLATDRWLGMDFVPVGAAGSEPARQPLPPTQLVPSGRVGESSVMPVPATVQPAFTPTGMTTEQKIAALAELEQQVIAFVQSSWPRDGWNRIVFGEGNPDAQILFIGEGPGSEEDAQGRPFVGPAGKLLDKQIAAMGLTREQVYIGNIAKTRPPGNRVPTPQEAEKWFPWLEKQIQIIGPAAIVALGATASKYLLSDPALAITRVRGQWRTYHGIPLMPTFHPAYLLRAYTPDNRRRVWEDLKKVLEHLGLPVPGA